MELWYTHELTVQPHRTPAVHATLSEPARGSSQLRMNIKQIVPLCCVLTINLALPRFAEAHHMHITSAQAQMQI